MPTINKSTKQILITTAIIISVFGLGAVIYNVLKNKNKEHSTVTAQGFNGIVQKAQKKHPAIYAWWDSLPVQNQISIESAMTPELLTFLDKDFSNRELSEQTKAFLRKAGYVG